MKCVILTGGYGSRMGEETVAVPKPMLIVGNRPLLWHIMKYYASYGFNEFILCLGYKQEIIKDYFINYDNNNTDITIRLGSSLSSHYETLHNEDWTITLVNTGLDTQTGGRIKRIQKYIDSTFMVTYGDGLSNIDLNSLLDFHKAKGKIATLSGVWSKSKFGNVELDNTGLVGSFNEKSDEHLINGGFFVFEPDIFDWIKDDSSSLEADVLPNLTDNQQLTAYLHKGFWGCCDSPKELRALNALYKTSAPWVNW